MKLASTSSDTFDQILSDFFPKSKRMKVHNPYLVGLGAGSRPSDVTPFSYDNGLSGHTTIGWEGTGSQSSMHFEGESGTGESSKHITLKRLGTKRGNESGYLMELGVESGSLFRFEVLVATSFKRKLRFLVSIPAELVMTL